MRLLHFTDNSQHFHKALVAGGDEDGSDKNNQEENGDVHHKTDLTLATETFLFIPEIDLPQSFQAETQYFIALEVPEADLDQSKKTEDGYFFSGPEILNNLGEWSLYADVIQRFARQQIARVQYIEYDEGEKAGQRKYYE